jgi:hypothetical protein
VTVAATPPGAKTDPDPAASGQPDETPKPPAPAATKAAPTEEDNETKAGKLMQLADNYLRAGLKSLAAKKLREILRKYPKTNVAIDAEAKLDTLK